MEDFQEEYKESLTATCRLLGVSRQVYYRAIKSKQKRRAKAQIVVELIKEVRLQMPRIGGRKLYYLLQKHLKSLGVGRDRLFAIMKANHLLIKPTRTYHITTNSHHRFRKHKNLIEQLTLIRPEQLWVSDITYVGNRDNPMYLALVTDAYSKKVLGYDLSNSLQTEGTLRALRMALGKRRYKDDKLIHHSDRGFQYCSHEYQKVLAKANVTCSMTESYDPYANAVAERINGILKHEFILDAKPKDLDVMKKLIKDSINIYNTKRPHYSCYYLTPNQMHLQNETKVRTYKTKNGSKNVFAAI